MSGEATRVVYEAQVWRHELVRPASLDLGHEDGFWRVTGVDYADEEADEPVEAIAEPEPA